MTTIRAKFRCIAETTTKWTPTDNGSRSYKFGALYDDTIPEDQRYATATPSGSLELDVTNPSATFEPGKAYYLDITPADA